MAEKPEPRLIRVIAYDHSWPRQFAKEALLIKAALGDNCIEVHHMGSTSVPHLAAKPVIDIIPVVCDLKQVDMNNALMKAIGYDVKGEHGIPFRRFFQKGGRLRTHHVHIFEQENPEIERHLKFRDWMRTHPQDRDAYGRLKQELALKHPEDIVSYCQGKEPFIAAIDKKAGFKELRMVQALTVREWDVLSQFRQLYFFDAHQLADPFTWTFDQDDHIHFVLYQGHEIIGYAHLQLWPEQRAAMRVIIIDKAKQNQQCGSQFLALCERWLKSHGYRSLHVESSASALGFYRNNGYVHMPFDDPEKHESYPPDTALGKML